MEIAVVAGEASGDRHASELINALRADPDLAAALKPGETLDFWGIGGVAMQKAGVRLVSDSREWGAIGIVEAITKAPRIYPAKLAILGEFRKNPPKALILVDFGAFNVPLGEWARDHGICPVYYYMPPGSWRRNASPKRLSRLARFTDEIVTPFPWSEKNLKDAGANVSFVGHPLLDLVKPSDNPEELDRQLGLDPMKTVITLLPGSRKHEVQHILPAMFGAAGEIAARVPGAQFLVALAPNLSRGMVEDVLRTEQRRGGNSTLLELMQQASGKIIRAAEAAIGRPPANSGPVLATSEGMLVDATEVESVGKARVKSVRPTPNASAPVALVEGMTYDAIARADLVISTSGTATLEAAILNRPMIIVYRGSKLMEIEWEIRKKALDIKFIGLPNILADRLVCPELIQEDASPESISAIAIEMLLQPDRLLKTKVELERVVREQLGEPGGIKRAASIFARQIVQGDQRH
jgi:lipid-A-disaccharide synthase